MSVHGSVCAVQLKAVRPRACFDNGPVREMPSVVSHYSTQMAQNTAIWVRVCVCVYVCVCVCVITQIGSAGGR